MRTAIALSLTLALSVSTIAVAQQQDAELHNVALTTLGATAKGTGSNFNKDWPAIGTLRPGGGGGTIFDPFEGATIDIRLVIPVDIKAIEIDGLDYHGTRQVNGVDIYIEGKKITHADLPENPGKPNRIAVEGHGQHIRLVGTGAHPIRTLKDGKKGPKWGGFSRIRVYSTTDMEVKMAPPTEYSVEASPQNIVSTSGSLVQGEVKVYGQPRMTKGHPCTIWDQQDIDHYKKMIKTSKQLGEEYAGLGRAMDQRIGEPVGVPEPIKGDDDKWQHLPALEYGSRQNKLALDIANLGTMYVLSGEEKYAEYAKKILLAYADVYDKYAPGNRPGFTHDVGKCFDQRLGDSTWLIQVARGYDLIYNLPSITTEERRHIEDNLLKAAARFIFANRAVMTAPTNWSAIGTCSILITGYATGDQELIDLAMYWKGTKEEPQGGVMLHFGERSIDADGMWSEGAMGYQFMAMQALIADAEILWHHGVDMYRYRDGVLKRLFDSPLEFSYPDLKTPAIHDSGHGSIVGHESYLYEFGYRRYRDPKYLLILNQAGMHLAASFQQFTTSVLYDRDPDEKTASVEWESVNLFGVGYGILRNTTEAGTTSLLMDYGPNRSHGHPDKLNVDLWAFGERLIPDPGSIWYEQPLYRNWYHTTVAHNTLCVDELEQMACGATQLVYGPADTMGIQRATTDEAYAGITMDRGVFLTADYMADIFGAFAQLPRKLDFCWHVVGDMQTDLPLKETTLPEPRERGYNSLDNMQHATTSKPWSATFKGKDKTARFVASGGTDTEVIIADGHLGLERPKTIMQRRESNQTIFGNAIDISGDGRAVKTVKLDGSLKDGYALLTVDTADGKDLCFVSYRPGQHELREMKTDAQQAFAVRAADDVTALYLGGGTSLSVGKTTIARSEPGLAYVEKAASGAYVVANPSPSEATVTLTLPGATGRVAYGLDIMGRRDEQIAVGLTPGGACSIPMPASSRVELAKQGEPSVYEHRQNMLRTRQEEQEAAMKAAESVARERTVAREKAAAEAPAPRDTAIAVQADAFSEQGGGEVKVSYNKRASIGNAILGWDGVGHWLEYTVEAPADGYYNMTLCYCSALALCERELQVNGEVQEPLAPMVFPGTGGWANNADDWQLHVAENPVAERPLLIKLNKGPNTVRLTNANGRGVNLDYLVFTSPDVKVTREKAAELLK